MKTRSILRRLRLPMLSAAALIAWGNPAVAQNASTWTGAGGNGNWSTAANWDTLPASGFDTELTFSGAANLATVQNITSGTTPFQLTALSYDGSAVVASISGAPLQFGPGTNPASINTNSGTGLLSINTGVTFTSATTININANNGNGAELRFGGPVVNPAGNVITVNTVPPGTLVLFTNPNNTSFAGTWAQAASTLSQLGAANAMWRTTVITLTGTCAVTAGTTTAAGNGIGDAGYNQQIGSVSGSGQFLVGTTDSAATVLLGFAGGNQTLSGSAGLAGFNTGSHFGKVGTGRLTVNNENASFNTALSVRDGGLELIGDKGSLTNSIAGPGALSIYAGAYLRAANNTAAPNYGGTNGRLSDTAAVRMAGGQLRFDSGSAVVVLAGSSNSTSELLGTLRPLAGLSSVVLNTQATAPTGSLTFASVTAADLARGGQVAFIGTSLGAAPGTGVANINFSTAPATVNGVIPWALSQAAYTPTLAGTVGASVIAPDSLAELGPNGVRPLATFADNDFSSATQNVRVTTAAAVAGGSANSLTIDAAGTITTSAPLTVSSGAIINRNPAGSIGGTGAITTTGRLYLSSTGALVVTAPISAASLSTGGNGAVTVGALNLTGTSPIIQANSGSLTFAGPITVGGGTPVFQLSRTATINGLPTVTGTLRGNGTVNGNVTMGVGSLIGGSALGSDVGGVAGTTGASPGTMAINGALAFTGGANSRLRFYMTSVFGGTYTQGLITATSLDLTGVTPAAPLTVQPHSIALANTDTGNVYDFDPTQNYTWTMIQSTTPIVGFNASAFSIDLANFTNPGVTASNFTVATQGNNLVLNYTSAIPEPTFLGLAGLGVLALVRRVRK